MSDEAWVILAAWTQAIGSILAIAGAVYAAGIPVRAQERDRRRQIADRLAAIRSAADALLEHRKTVAHGILEREQAIYQAAADRLNTHDHAKADSILSLPVGDWPSLDLHANMVWLRSAADELDEVIGKTGGSYGVVQANSHLTFPPARAMRLASAAFEEAWSSHHRRR